MNHEDSRLRTFSAWPSDAPIDAARIANGGFFYTGQGMEVQCFSCGGKISEWNPGDHVMTKHRRLDPRCPFIVDPISSGNVPKQSQNSHNNVHQTQSIQIQPPSVEIDREPLQNSLNARLETFSNWPVSHVVTPQCLAEAGFYSLQHGDRVKCAFCYGVVGFWEMGDDPKSEHRRHFPECSFVAGNFNEQGNSNPGSSSNVTVTSRTPTDLQELGIQTHKGPKMPDFATLESRLRTYKNWPGDLIQTPQMLSEAGFYYVGTGDQVRCFHCDGGLRHWDPEDEPWIEHAKWFPTCAYVRIVKGADFINTYKPEGETGETKNEPNPNKQSLPFVGLRTITEADVQAEMRSQPVIEALNIGIDLGRIKHAIKYKLQMTGTGFLCTDTLIEAALNMELDDLDSETTSEEVSRILSTVLLKYEQQTLSQNQSIEKHKNENEEVKVTESKMTKTDSQKSVVSLSLEEENRLLREARLCKICMDNEIGVVFLPCGHLTTCVTCAPSLKDCPVCRSTIKATVRTFLS